MSLPEVIGHLRDHCTVSEGTLLHWLFPGKELDSGLRVLVDDNSCLMMSNTTIDGGVADIYVEEHHLEEDADEGHVPMGDDNDYEDELEDELEDEYLEEGGSTSPSKKGKEILVKGVQQTGVNKSRRRKRVDVEEGSSADSDYMPGDSSSSEDDEEEAEILKKFWAFKKKWRKGDCASLDDVVLEGSTALPTGFECNEGEEGYGTPYVASSDNEATEDELVSDGELVRRSDGPPRFKKSKGTPVFFYWE